MGGSVTTFGLAVVRHRILGLDVAGVDPLESRDGPLVLEVNASPGLDGIARTNGVDVASAVIEHVELRRVGLTTASSSVEARRVIEITMSARRLALGCAQVDRWSRAECSLAR